MRHFIVFASVLAISGPAMAAEPGLITITTADGRTSFPVGGAPKNPTGFPSQGFITPSPVLAPISNSVAPKLSVQATPAQLPIERWPIVSVERNAVPAELTTLTPAASSTLTLIGAPTLVEGDVSAGEPVLTGEVRPTITGRLKQPLHGIGGEFLSGRDVPAGAPVYAVRLGGQVFWCAPDVEQGSLFKHRATVCVRKDALWWRRAEGEDVPFVTHLIVSAGNAGVYEPAVSREPVDFERHFRIGYSVLRWTADHAVIQRRILWDGKAYPFGCDFDTARGPGGDAELVAFGQVYRLTPGTNDRNTHISFLGRAASPGEQSLETSNVCPSATTLMTTSVYTRTGFAGHGHH